jgi:hypothetical protein
MFQGSRESQAPSQATTPKKVFMSFTIRPFHRFPVQCPVTYNAGPFLKMPLAHFSGFGSSKSMEENNG